MRRYASRLKRERLREGGQRPLEAMPFDRRPVPETLSRGQAFDLARVSADHSVPVSDRSSVDARNERDAERIADASVSIESVPNRTEASVRPQTTPAPMHGGPLQPQARDRMESLLGTNLGAVRIHADTRSAEAAAHLNARAFTVGRDIAFAAGQYRPDTISGRHLLAHEVAHTVQQTSSAAPLGVQRVPEDEKPAQPAVAAPPDAETLLGQRLWREFPAGVNVTFYDDSEPEIARRAIELAQRERSIGATKAGFTAADLSFGVAFADSKFKIGDTIPKLSAELKKAADKAGQPGNVQPAPDTGPTQIRSLTVFAHGTATWCGISNSLTTGNAPALIKKVAAHLTSDVNLVLYACSVARGRSENEAWQKGTMEGGGADSLGAMIRDALVTEGKVGATVWGHTTVGHTSRNWALRVFKASTGKGSAGSAFAGEEVFGAVERLFASMDIDSEIAAVGHLVPPEKQEQLTKRQEALTEQAFYDCYREANRTQTYDGVHLAEQAPNYPLEVAKVINDYWDATFWPARKKTIAQTLIKQFALPKTPATGVPAAP